jgi:hypothetical protein
MQVHKKEIYFVPWWRRGSRRSSIGSGLLATLSAKRLCVIDLRTAGEGNPTVGEKNGGKFANFLSWFDIIVYLCIVRNGCKGLGLFLVTNCLLCCCGVIADYRTTFK